MSRLRVHAASPSRSTATAPAPTRAWTTRSASAAMALHEWVFATRTFQTDVRQGGGTTGVDDDFAARGFDEHRRVDHGPQHVRPGPRPLARRQLEGMVGRRPAVPRAGLRATHHAAPVDRDGGRHDLPLRHRRHPGGAASAHARPPRQGRPARRRRRHDPPVPARRTDRRDAPRDLAGAARLAASRCSPASTCRRSAIACSEHVPTPQATHVVLTRNWQMEGDCDAQENPRRHRAGHRGVLIYAATQPDTFTFSAAPPSPRRRTAVSADQRREGLQHLEPIGEEGSCGKLAYEGAASGVGAAYGWDSDELGAGRMEIIDAAAPNRVHASWSSSAPSRPPIASSSPCSRKASRRR